MAKKLLEIKELFVEYKTDEADVYAINGLNLSLDEGETLGLVGETGAGKTTTALSILKLLPDRTGFIKGGSIVLDGAEVTSLTDQDMRLIRGNTVSMIFQDPMTSLNPIIPVGKQIAEILELHKNMKKQQVSNRVDEILTMVGLPSDRKNEYPHQFSGGMKQRIVIAIALACEPKLLIADEPTTALDVTIQAQVLDLMEDLKRKLNTSMLLITHDLGIVAQTCDKVAIMYAGEIIEYGTVQDIFENDNHHPYVEGLFGSIPDMKKVTKRLNPIYGLMPDPTVKIKGCKFYDRCIKHLDMCKTRSPENLVKGTHVLKCHLFQS